MEALLERNTKRAAAAAAAEAAAAAAAEEEAAVAAQLPPAPLEALLAAAAGDAGAAVGAGSAAAPPGVALPLAPGAPRGGPHSWAAPWGVEVASVEHEVAAGGGAALLPPPLVLPAGGGPAAEAMLAAARSALADAAAAQQGGDEHHHHYHAAPLPSLLDIGPATVAEGGDLIAEMAAVGGDVVFIGAPGVVEVADGAAGAAELLGAAADFLARGAGGRMRVGVVGGALCALAGRIGLGAAAFTAVEPAPGAGVALMLAAARRSGLTRAVPPVGDGLRALN
jgi:hypothetical protein